MTERDQGLREAVEAMHQCQAIHRYPVPITETFRGETVWDGVVEIFDLTGHPRARRCYAWSDTVGDQTHYTAVLELPPVTSARSAVQVAIVQKTRQA